MNHSLILQRLSARARPNGGWLARCPAHDDHKPSLSLDLNLSGRLILCCHAGCNVREITKAIGLPLECYGLPPAERTRAMANPQIAATYDYTDAKGLLLYQSVRYEPKDFRYRRPDGNGGWLWNLDGVERVPFNLVEIVNRPEQPVLIVEGEKDVLTLKRYGLVATTNCGGAGKWNLELGWHLKGRRVAILPDNDAAGFQHSLFVAASMLNYATEIRIVYLVGLPDKGDVSDWFSMRLPTQTDDDLKAAFVDQLKSAPQWKRTLVREKAEA